MIPLERVKRQPGIAMALVFHLMLFAIPMSTLVVPRLSELDLFVIEEERPLVKRQIVKEKKIEIPPKPVIPEVIKEPEVIQPLEVPQKPDPLQKQKIIEQPVVEQPLVKTEIVEPAIKSDRDGIPVVPKVEISLAPVTPVKEPQTVSPSPPASPLTVEKPKELEEVEFGGENGPRFLKKEMPVYPVLARRLGKEGRVVLRLTIDEQGRLVHVEILENSGFGFAESAMDAVKRSTFIPAKKENKPFASKAILPIRFTLRRGE